MIELVDQLEDLFSSAFVGLGAWKLHCAPPHNLWGHTVSRVRHGDLPNLPLSRQAAGRRFPWIHCDGGWILEPCISG